MVRNIKVLLTENVDNLGIVGDVVNVRTGYARNFLLPRRMATRPSDEAIAAVAAKRAEAQRQLEILRSSREAMTGKLEGVEITLQRSCNDQGVLYAAVTQQDIADALRTLGFDVKPREVRMGQTIKTIDTYQVAIKFDTDLSTTIKVWVVADRKLEVKDDKVEIEIDENGEMVDPTRQRRRSRDRDGERKGEPKHDSKSEAKPEAKAKGEPKPAKAEKAKAKG